MIPPNQKKVEELIKLDLGLVPEIKTEDYRLSIKGEIENPFVLTYNDIVTAGTDKVADDFHCVTGWTKESAEWEGILSKKIAVAAKPAKDAKYVLIGSYDGYTTNLDIDFFLKDNSLIAIKYGGKILTPEHGFPARLVIPDKYAYKKREMDKIYNFFKKRRTRLLGTKGLFK